MKPETIAQAGALAALAFRGYAIDPAWVARADEPERLSLGDLIRTAIVHLQLPARRDSGNTFAPLTADDVAWARDHLRLPDGHLLPALASDLRARCLAVGAPQHADVFITTLLGRLEVEAVDDRGLRQTVEDFTLGQGQGAGALTGRGCVQEMLLHGHRAHRVAGGAQAAGGHEGPVAAAGHRPAEAEIPTLGFQPREGPHHQHRALFRGFGAELSRQQ